MTDAEHFSRANESVYKRMQTDPDFKRQMQTKYPGAVELVQPRPNGTFRGTSPANMTWHHGNKPGSLQLADFNDHKTYHKIYHPDGKGGRNKWGGGTKYRKQGVLMITINGFDELLQKRNDLPNAGWLYVDTDFDLESENDILNRKYYLAENDDEEMEFDDEYGTFLESPILKAIIENKIEHHPNSSKEELLKAVTYYLENDDFLD
ncbi:HNH endonuclease [Pseudomonas sp. B21-015]|nr:HNH endonuclease [Pseudomonas sp. B21-015]